MSMICQPHAPLIVRKTNVVPMRNEIIQYIRLFSTLSVAIPGVLYIINLGRLRIHHHIIGGLLVALAAADSIAYLGIYPIQSVANVYSIIQFILITTFYYFIVYKKRSALIMFLSIGVYLSTLIFELIENSFGENYTALWSVGSLMIALYGITYIFTIPTMTVERYFDRNLLSNVILAASSFSYAVVSFLIFALADVIFERHDADTIDAFWSLHNIFNIMKNIGFALGFYYVNKREIYITLEQLEKIAKKLEEGE